MKKKKKRPTRILRAEEVTAENFPEIREMTPEELKEAYSLSRANFTAADLQKFTEPMDDGVPAEDVLREMEETQRRHDESHK
jgi:hypothetical protein